MKKRTINLGPFGIYLWGGLLVIGGASWGAGAWLTANPQTGRIYPEQLANGTPVPGYVPVAGYCTSTATGTSAGTSADRQCWKPVPSGLPSGTPGQIPQNANTTGTYTYTATGTQTMMTGTQTTTTTEWKATNGTIGFDPMGTFYFYSCDSECAPVYSMRWGELSGWGTAPQKAISGTCSTGSDALLFTSTQNSSGTTRRSLWPAGQWLASVRAKVNANGAAIRIEVWDYDPNTATSTQWFNWTTDVFSNTSYQDITKMAYAAERKNSVGTDGNGDPVFHDLIFKMYATCSTSTTVDIDMVGTGTPTVRIESPIAIERMRVDDVGDLRYYLGQKESLIAGVPGQVIGFLGTGTDLTYSKGPVDREPVISGTPGQFVKFAGTGTATTTTKEGVTVSIPTPVTTRKFSVPASAFSRAGGGTSAGQLGSYPIEVVPLRDGQNDYAYSYAMTFPADYSSGMSVSVIWSPGSTDSTSGHTVKWRLGYLTLVDGTSIGSSLSSTAWTGDTCGTRCTSGYILKETAHSVASSLSSASSPFSIYLQRDGSDASDTYVGTANFIGLEFSYTSSL